MNGKTSMEESVRRFWLAPLRGVTIRAFRESFAAPLRDAGFDGAFAPFIPANPGIRVTERMLAELSPFPSESPQAFPLVPQVITRHPSPMRELLKAFKDRGFDRADLNAGCPFPMIRRRGRGSGLFKTPDVLEELLAAGCDEMGAGRFSLKIRLGLERPDELERLMPRINRYPLAALTVHARTARQMYDGEPDMAAFARVAEMAECPVIYNGDARVSDWTDESTPVGRLRAAHPRLTGLMVGRSFVRDLGRRTDISALLADYMDRSCAELCGDRPVLGRMKELVAYWTDQPRWRRLWPIVKICSTVEELRQTVLP